MIFANVMIEFLAGGLAHVNFAELSSLAKEKDAATVEVFEPKRSELVNPEAAFKTEADEKFLKLVGGFENLFDLRAKIKNATPGSFFSPSELREINFFELDPATDKETKHGFDFSGVFVDGATGAGAGTRPVFYHRIRNLRNGLGGNLAGEGEEGGAPNSESVGA